MGQAGVDPADIVWNKMQTLQEKYLEDMKDLYNVLTTRSRQHMPPEQLQKLTHYKTELQLMMPYLVAAKGSLPEEFKQDKVEAFEKQIVSIMALFKKQKQGPQQSQHQPTTLGQQAQAVQQSQQAPQDLELKSNVPSIQQAMDVASQPTSLSSLADANAKALHQNYIASFSHSAINRLQTDVPGMQTQQQDQHFHRNRLLKDQEQSKHLQARQLQQQQQQQAQLLQVQPGQLQPLSADASRDSKLTKHTAMMKQMIFNQPNAQSILQQMQQQQQQKGSSLQAAASPQMSPVSQLSPQNELHTITIPALLVPKVGRPLQASTPPFMAPSPSPVVEDSKFKLSTPAVPLVAPAVVGQTSHSAIATPSGPSTAIGTRGLSVSALLGDCTPSPQTINLQDRTQTHLAGNSEERQTEPPMKRLTRAINNMSSQALVSAVDDMDLLVNLADKLGGSTHGVQSRAAVGEDLAQVTRCRTQARVLSSPDGVGISTKVKRRVDSMAKSLVSSDGSVVNSLQKLGSTDLETECTATSGVKRSKLEIGLLEEINRVNDRLLETRVEIDPHQQDEEAAGVGKDDGIVVRCLYNPIAIKPNINFRNDSFHVAFPPLRFLIPPQYPHCSPIVLEDESATNPNNFLSCQAWDTFKKTVRSLPQPVLLADMVKAWDASAHNAILEAAILQGGGSFSSTYGSWESCDYT